MFEALFSIEIAAKCKEIAFFASKNHAVARVLGSPQGPKKAQKACFGAMLGSFEACWPLFRLRRAPAPTKPKNSRREPQKEPPAAPEAKTAPQEARNAPQKAPKRASKEAQTGLDLEGPVGLLFVAFWGAFSTPRCRRSCPCCCLLWCSVFCMLEFCSFVCCCCGGFGSPWLLVLRSCFWVFLRSAEQATNRLEPKRGRRQGRSR